MLDTAKAGVLKIASRIYAARPCGSVHDQLNTSWTLVGSSAEKAHTEIQPSELMASDVLPLAIAVLAGLSEESRD